MLIIFFLIILFFSISAAFYLYANDFNSKTLGVIFPAVGAMVFSLYLGVKSILIDAPEPVISQTTIAILHDRNNGDISSMLIPTASDPPEMFNKFRGLRKFDTYRLYNDFKDLDVWNLLKSNLPNLQDGRYL